MSALDAARTNSSPPQRVRNLVVVFGNQLNADSVAFDGFDRQLDAVLLMEVREEATYVLQHKIRLVLFFSAMRHFRNELCGRGLRVYYRQLDDPGNTNFDAKNRNPLPSELARSVPDLATVPPDNLTDEVKRLVETHFTEAPGSLARFDYSVTRAEALNALRDFIQHRLPLFGPYQDAMSTNQDYLYHPRLSSSLNLHLLAPGEVMQAALNAYEQRLVTLASVEGFIRQILGWREFVRGIYWLHMPSYATLNELSARLPVPRYFWTAETDMQCVRSAAESLKQHAYTPYPAFDGLGLHCLLLGVHPYKFHEWPISMFVDAIDWASLPNALGMSQFGDGGIMGTKPYCASGSYIHRMSNYCRECRYHPRRAIGPDACPFTTLYWDFLDRPADRFKHNPRMRFQLLNLQRRDKHELVQIRRQADQLKQSAC